MIKSIHIRNYAIIDQMDIELSDGLNIITGETGAGKSILLGATGLILGQRADTKVQFEKGLKTIVEAVFKISKTNLLDFFEKNELDYEAETIVRREITSSGKSRAFINDTPVSLRILQSLSNQLVDLHQQFDTLELQEEQFQLEAIDALAGHDDLLKLYRQNFQEYKQTEKEIAEKQMVEAKALQEKDFLQFQLNELKNLNLQDGELVELEKEQALLAHAEKMAEILHNAVFLLEESEQPMNTLLKEIIHQMNEIKGSVKVFDQLGNDLESLIIELEEWSRAAQKTGDSLESNPARLTEVTERLNEIYQIQRKHQIATQEELMEIMNNFDIQLESIQSLGDEIDELKIKLSSLEKTLSEQSGKLSGNRKKVAITFEHSVLELLGELHMQNARMKVDIVPSDRFLSSGKDIIQFLFTANKGGTLMPIKKVASGGELSRLSLCIKSVVAGKMDLPTLIFDEIDTGISGEVAQKMGNIIQDLARRHQIIMITHSPQIASKAQRHFFVRKNEANTKTLANIELLKSEQRIIEIAKMLSGDPPSDSAIMNAKELMQV